MRAEDWFGVALRFVGITVLLYGVRDLIDHLLHRLGYFSFPETSPRYCVVMGPVQIFAGLHLLRGAPPPVRFAFPDAPDDEDDVADGDAPPATETDDRARPAAR